MRSITCGAVRSTTWLGARPVAVALCAASCLLLAACSGGKAAASAHPSPRRTAALTEPSTGPAAVAAVKADWQSFFNGALSIPHRLKLLQDGQDFVQFIRSQANTSIGALVLEAGAKVSSVTLGPPGRASVVYTILLAGKPLESNLHGTAVYSDGSWHVAASTFCGLLHLAYGAKNRLLPAVCGG
ncbi:MAG TPA: hypothetical protein VNF47_04440 [Streptosporangiaceae bacterium]|nr:hypothetical protein [Streptosporangiaceae bacterium]